MSEQGEAWATELTVECGGEVPKPQVLGVAVDLDLNQAPMAMITLRNEQHRYSNQVSPGDAVKIKAGDVVIFDGEAVGLEPRYLTKGASSCVVRAFSKMHRLLRGRKSRTFLDQSDQDIAGVIAGECGLSLQAGSDPSITHKHIYQHNQTNLEFLRLRAARLGFDVWVDGTDLYFDKPKTDRDSGIKLIMGSAGGGDEIPLTSFTPRLSTAGLVSKVTVRGWDPEKKEEIVGEASPSSSPLGSNLGTSAISTFGTAESYEVDHPVFSVEEANAIAESRLHERMMGYITGDLVCRGTAGIKPGIVVEIKINVDDANDQFNGKYLIVGTSHTYSPMKGSGDSASGGFQTMARVARDAASSGAQGGDQETEAED